MLQAILCPKCGRIKDIENKLRARTQTRKCRTLCQTCKKLHKESIILRNKSTEIRKLNKQRMEKENPMFMAETRAKVASTQTGELKSVEDYRIKKEDLPKETPAELSERMKRNNPMFDEEIKARAVETKRERVAAGIISYKRGSEHHLWKGNRDFNNSCRSVLYNSWTKKVLHRDGYSCQRCGERKDLQVHHLSPLREMIGFVKDKYNIETFLDIPSEEWQSYIDEVVSLHNLKDGITVCKECHRLIDEQFRG